MVFEKNRVRAALLALPLAVGLSLGAATAAHAAETDDPRATAYDGNAKTCADAGLSGDRIVQVDGENDYGADLITYEGGTLNEDQYLDITAVDEGVTVTGIVVKGGDGYNLYIPGGTGGGGEMLSETPPWTDLRSPLNNGGAIPALSHWYVCGSYTAPTSTTTTATTTTTSETSATETTTAPSTSEETTTTETSGLTTSSVVSSSTTEVAAPTSSSVPPAIDNTSDDGDLATTGFGGGWLIWAGVLFLLGGVGTIAGARALRRQ